MNVLEGHRGYHRVAMKFLKPRLKKKETGDKGYLAENFIENAPEMVNLGGYY